MHFSHLIHHSHILITLLGHGSVSEIYHHHFYSPCLAEQAGDNFTGHSPLYAFAFDSYPIYGPYQDTGCVGEYPS
jgi:hypothetical protein